MTIDRPPRRWRGVLLWSGAAVLAALTAAQGLGGAATRGDPGVALRLAPFNGRAMNRLVEQRMAAMPVESYSRLQPLAWAALSREPLSVASVRLLATAAALGGDEPRAGRLLDYAGRLTRRDLPTQLLLIERAVTGGDAAAALRQFDITLRTSQQAYPTLFPILASAIADPYFVAPMTRIARSDPSWFRFFVGEAITTDAALPNLARVLTGAPGTATAADTALQANLLDRLVATGQIAAARRYHRGLHPAAAGAVVDAAFQHPEYLPPFGWRLAADPELGAEFVGGEGLRYFASVGRSGPVASQLVTLQPGRYRLEALFGQAVPAGIAWRLLCEASSADLTVGRQTGTGRLLTRFAVPASCAAQRLSLEVAGSDTPEGVDGTVRRVALLPEPIR